MSTWLIYVDDSGNEEHDLLSAVCIPIEDWLGYLAEWKKYRRYVQKKIGLPPSIEIHGEEMLHRGDLVVLDEEGQPLTIPEQRDPESPSTARTAVFDAGLRTIGSFSTIRLLTVYAPVANGKGGLYEGLIDWLERWLAWNDGYGLVWFDGTDQGLDRVRRAVHRGLPIADRRVIEDPTGRDSRHSHLLQIADMVVHTAFKGIRAHEGHETRPIIAGGYKSRLSGLLEPALYDEDAFPVSDGDLDIRGYSP